MTTQGSTSRRGKSAAPLALLLGTILALSPGYASAHQDNRTDRTPARNAILEVNVTDDPLARNGQPMVAVNPRNKNNLVFSATGFGVDDSSVLPFAPCVLAYSKDRGETWNRVPWPGTRPGCGIPEIAVDAQGTFYIHNNQLGCPPGVVEPYQGYCNVELNRTQVSRSTDGGVTWSTPVQTPHHIAARGHLRVDVATGMVYSVGGLEPLMPNGISVSADQGRTWSNPVPAVPDSPACESVPPWGCGPLTRLAVHNGVLATASVTEAGVSLHVSRDDGRTFRTRPVTGHDGTPITGRLTVTNISADPTRTGRFAVMIGRIENTTSYPFNNFDVYITDNSGATWSSPKTIQAPSSFNPWMEFGLHGELGVVWRAGTTPEGGLDAYATVSLDRGRTFSTPFKVNARTQPVGSAGGAKSGDFQSGLVFSDRDVFISWSDGRTGTAPATDGIVARVPLSRFRQLR